MSNDLTSLFEANDLGSQRMWDILNDPDVQDIKVNRFDRIFFTDRNGGKMVDRVFASPENYVRWLDQLLALTDVGYTSVSSARTSVIEGSFRPDRCQIHGSIHIATGEITRGEPVLTVRKQPNTIVTLDNMFEQNMMSVEMRLFLEQAVRGRSNLLISGGSGAGKTTLARALSWYIDPSQRVLTAEEIDELHLSDRLPNVVALTTYREMDNEGRIIREVKLEDLVREALRMRADRIWVGETRGKEALALITAANSGHDGCLTTIHGDNGQQAVKQLVSYVMFSGLAEEVARDQVAQAFHLVVQIRKMKMGRRVITEITELEAVREGAEQRRNPLYLFDPNTEQFVQVGHPTNRLRETWARYGANYDDLSAGNGGY